MSQSTTELDSEHTRRQLLRRLFSVLASTAVPMSWSQELSKRPVIADMHSHLGVIGRAGSPADLASEMRAHAATLVAWKIVADGPWLMSLDRGIVQRSVPTAQELWEYFEREVKRLLAYAQANQLPIIKTSADIDAASRGTHSVLLSCEGADFLGGKMEPLSAAFDVGLRQLQLVHYIRNPVGDFQTESPVHNGLSTFGREVVVGCQEKGILVD
jgi:membrane dipeptidase